MEELGKVKGLSSAEGTRGHATPQTAKCKVLLLLYIKLIMHAWLHVQSVHDTHANVSRDGLLLVTPPSIHRAYEVACPLSPSGLNKPLSGGKVLSSAKRQALS